MTEQADKPVYTRMTDEQVTTLARDLVKNMIFMSDQLRRPEDVDWVFPLLRLMDPDHLKKMLDAGVSIFYEYVREALPRSINGYPMFMSVRWMTEEDYTRVRAEERRMRIALGEIAPDSAG